MIYHTKFNNRLNILRIPLNQDNDPFEFWTFGISCVPSDIKCCVCREFVGCVRCIRILSPSEVQQMSEEGMKLLNSGALQGMNVWILGGGCIQCLTKPCFAMFLYKVNLKWLYRPMFEKQRHMLWKKSGLLTWVSCDVLLLTKGHSLFETFLKVWSKPWRWKSLSFIITYQKF